MDNNQSAKSDKNQHEKKFPVEWTCGTCGYIGCYIITTDHNPHKCPKCKEANFHAFHNPTLIRKEVHSESSDAASSSAIILYWTCEKCEWVDANKPEKCPLCGNEEEFSKIFIDNSEWQFV